MNKEHIWNLWQKEASPKIISNKIVKMSGAFWSLMYCHFQGFKFLEWKPKATCVAL